MPRVLFLAAGLLIAPAGPARAEWQHFGMADGLPANGVVSILEDRTGDFWFGGEAGVTRYDGSAWRTFTTADGLASNVIMRMLQDRAGRIWFGGHPGLSRLDGGTWSTLTSSDGLASAWINAMLEDRAGRIWLATPRGACRWDGEVWRSFTVADGLINDGVTSISEDPSGALWFGTSAGLSHFDGTTWRNFTTADGLPGDYVFAVLADRSGILWVATEAGGVGRYDGARWSHLTVADGLVDDHVHSIFQDRAGNLWFETIQGASRYDGRHWRSFRRSDGLADDQVGGMMQDRAGNLWFGGRYGVTRFDGSGWSGYGRSDGIAADVVMAVVEDRAERLWFATWGGGVSRLDSGVWRTFTSADGLADNYVNAAIEDRAGNLWFGTDVGASRFDGSAWTTYLESLAVPGNPPLAITVNDIAGDVTGNLWFGTSAGAYRYDGASWRRFTVNDGLAGSNVRYVFCDRTGNPWCSTLPGLSRFDGTAWRTFTMADGLPDSMLLRPSEDTDGNLWFGGRFGVSRFDGTTWRLYTTADGLSGNAVTSVLHDRAGNLWFGGLSGVTRYDGRLWGHYSVADGLANDVIVRMTEDRSGAIWFATALGASRLEPDSVPPRAVVVAPPPALSPSTSQTITFDTAFRESKGIQYSWSLDGSPWSSWSPTSFQNQGGLADGIHVFRVRARDQIGNVQPEATVCEFEVDATPPAPILSAPSFGDVVRGTVAIRGTTTDSRFRNCRVESRAPGPGDWNVLAESSVPSSENVLALWATDSIADGEYELRLSVTDSLGLTGAVLVRVIVDNHEPWADVTAPAMIGAASGGHLYTANAELHLYFPPHAFTRDARVSLTALTAEAVPDSLDGGGRLLPGYEIGWSGGELTKPATLELSYAVAAQVPGTPLLYASGADSAWRRLGGTVDAAARRLSAPLRAPGRYALFARAGVASGVGGISIVALTPRVFSPGGGFADQQVAISFALGRPGAVTVRIHSRAGRLVREVVSGESMSAGVNLVRWDGADRQGRTVAEGLYLVSIEALGEKQTRTVAVVR